MKPIPVTTVLIVLLVLITGCKKEFSLPTSTQTAPGNTAIAPIGFNFGNLKVVNVSVRLLAPNNTPLVGVPLNFYPNVQLLDNGNANDKYPLFTTRVSDKNGYINARVVLPANIDTVLADAAYAGFIRNAKLYVSGGSINAVLGGTNGISGNYAANVYRPAVSLAQTLGQGAATTYNSMGGADSYGRPNYLAKPGDVISAKLLSYLNASLPEGKDLRVTHPQYLTNTANGTINVVQQSDVYITFMGEGASYQNSVGYYTYPTGTPPASPADVKVVTIMYPNASLPGSGGNLHAGDKVKLGNFAAGTSIGFVLFSNAWRGGVSVNTGATKFYTDASLNPEADENLKRHSVLLNDAEDNLFVVGFEDMLRTDTYCDNDFNDVVFYATTQPGNGISPNGVEPIDEPYDTDGDGVSNVFDQYPNDPTRAYNTYYPSANSFSTIAFEDNWPNKGDYDMNDLVVNYRYKFVSNAQNQVVEMYADYAVQAAGATFMNGFGVQFPFSASIVKQATGQKLAANHINLAGNGVEAGQTNAVIIPFDTYEALINNYAGAYFINTKQNMPTVTGDTAHVYMQFTQPISFTTLGDAPFNPFLISNERRGYEIHLPNGEPTDKADKTLFGTGDDASIPSQGIYYVSKNNWPWALNFPGNFNYPQEGISIANAYPHFIDWAGSGGLQYTDWYSNNAAGYVNTADLYQRH